MNAESGSMEIYMDDRIEREKSFHNSRFSTEPSRSKALASRMFSITKEALNATYARIEAGSPGKRVLEYGCGQGEASLIIAKKYNPKSMVGIDVSDIAVDQARSEATTLDTFNICYDA
jgi:cyclopropane fatty-acyl-phospholipid synthase-like methyltransferase